MRWFIALLAIVALGALLPDRSAIAQSLPEPAPSATPSAAPSAGTLQLTRATLTLAPGQVAYVGLSGATGTPSLTSSAAVARVRYDAATSSIVVTAVALGSAEITVTDPGGSTVTLAVSVLPAAGTIPSSVTVTLGGIVSPQFAAAAIAAAVTRAAALQPGATVAVAPIATLATLHPGDRFAAIATVTIAGGAQFADQTGSTSIALAVRTLDQLEPAFLFYSDDPEKLEAGDDGVLYRATLDPAHPARLYAYHVSDTPDRRLYLVLRTTGAPASVQVLGYAAGPANAYAYVGHVSTLDYLLERATQESAIVDVASGSSYVRELGYRALGPGDLVTAIFDLRIVAGGPVDVEVVDSSGPSPDGMLDDPEHAGDGHGRRGEFALTAIAPLGFTYAAGDPEPAPLDVGDPTIPNLRAGGRALGGDYGVLFPVALQLSNSASQPQTVYLYERALAGGATTTIWFTGDPRPTEIPCLHVAENRYLVRSFALAPGESESVGGEYMTDGASSFPIEFGLTMVPPSPPPGPYSPDACNPKTPPATPSPAPSESAEPADTPSPSASASP